MFQSHHHDAPAEPGFFNPSIIRPTPQPTWIPASGRGLDKDGPESPFLPLEETFTERPIFESFREVAERCPAAIAVHDGTLSLTYGELLSLAHKITDAIFGSAACPVGAVGILLPNSAWYPAAILGCLAAGCPYVALDTRYPAERNTTIIAQAGIRCLITHGSFADTASIPIDGIRIVDLANLPSRVGSRQDGAFSAIDVGAPAIILYTSGSSGQPKGIVNSQRALLQRVLQYVNSCHIGPDDVLMPLSSLCTIAGTREVLTALLTGARLHMLDPEAAGLRGTRAMMRQGQVTVCYAVPALLRALIEVEEDNTDFHSLRVMRVGGDRVLWSDITLLRQAMAPGSFIQIGYSSTETTGSQWFVPHEREQAGSCVPVGYPLPGLTFTILDEEGVAVTPGEVGELVVRSPYVALGQWRNGCCEPGHVRADAASSHLRILATGDLVQLGADGLLEVVGRKDRQIKINGQRVEPAELEALLRRSEHVRDTAVIARRDGAATALVAFVVPTGGAPSNLMDVLRDAIRTSLPVRLHPARLHLLDELPRLPSAKLDTLALDRADDARRLQASEAHSPSRPDGSAPANLPVVLHAWCKVLRRRHIPLDRGWDEIGGDSLRLLRVVYELEGKLGRKLPLERLYMSMTAVAFAVAIAPLEASLPQQPTADNRPMVVLLPGLNDDSPSLASLRQDLSDRFRFTLVAYPPWREMLDRYTSIEAIAEAVHEQVVAAVPAGEVNLAGYSLGGAVGYEVARRLTSEGRSIGVFQILDTNIAPGGACADERWLDITQRWWAGASKILWGSNTLRRPVCYKLARWLTRAGRETLLSRIARAEMRTVPAALRFELEQQLREAVRRRLMERWISSGRRDRLPGAAWLFRSEEKRPMAPRDLGWSACFETVKVIDVSGDHLTMLQLPHRATMQVAWAAIQQG